MASVSVTRGVPSAEGAAIKHYPAATGGLPHERVWSIEMDGDAVLAGTQMGAARLAAGADRFEPMLFPAPFPEGGRTNIVISTKLIDVHPRPKRAHQGWRYLEDADAPRDLADGETCEVLPAQIAADLAKLGLV